MQPPLSTALQQDATQRDALLDAYVHDTQLHTVLESWLRALATRFAATHTLPANPFPSLLRAVRRAELARAFELTRGTNSVDATAEPELLAQQPHAASSDPQLQLWTTSALAPLGLSASASVLQRLDTQTLAHRVKSIRAAYAHVPVSWFTVAAERERDGDFSVAVVSALVGASNSFALATFPTVELERHVIVSGELLEPALAVFARQLFKRLHELSTAVAAHDDTILSDCCLSITTIGSQVERTQWTTDRVLTNRSAFASAVKVAVVSNAHFALVGYNVKASAAAAAATLVRLTQTFFFHFDAIRPTALTSQSTRSRSFVTASRIVDSGVLLDSHDGLDVVTRVQVANNNSKRNDAAAKTSAVDTQYNQQQQPIDASGIVEHVLATLAALTTSPSAVRDWTDRFASSITFTLLRLALAVQLLMQTLDAIGNNDGDAGALLTRHVEMLEREIASLRSRARIGVESSLVSSTEKLLGALWRAACDRFDASKAAQDDAASVADAFVCVYELLLLLAQSAVRDFVDSAAHCLRKPSPSQVADDDNDAEQQIDVLQALEHALNNRTYPPLIALELVFAQYVVDTCIDIACESAVMNIVACHLPPNPFVELSHKLRAFAVQQLVWTQPLTAADTAVLRPVDDNGDVLDDRNRIVTLQPSVSSTANDASRIFVLNRRLRDVLDAARVWRAFAWLERHQLLRASMYQPAKGSYAVQTVASLLALHPLAFAPVRSSSAGTDAGDALLIQDVVQTLELVELVVVEGRDFTQALDYFADAVALELQRLSALTSNSSNGNVDSAWLQVRVLAAPLGRVVSDVDVAAISDAALRQLLRETALAQCVLHARVTLVAVPLDSSDSSNSSSMDAALVYVVGKVFVFVHEPTAVSAIGSQSNNDDAQHARCVMPLAAFRLKRFGLFRSREAATAALRVVDAVDIATVRLVVLRECWTPAARYAFAAGDELLAYELDVTTAPDSCRSSDSAKTSSPPLSDVQRQFLLQRLTTHSPLLRLYSIERASWWLLQLATTDQHCTTQSHPLHAAPVRTVLQTVIRQAAATLAVVNCAMQYVEAHAAVVDTLRTQLAQPLPRTADDVVELQRALRRLWLHVRVTRFALQRDFFANY